MAAFVYRRQPPRGAKVASGSAFGKNASAVFLFNGDFSSAVRGADGAPVSTGPTIGSGPDGYFAQGNGVGGIRTNLLPSMLGVAGSAPRTVIVEFFQGDTNQSKIAYSFGDSSTTTRSQFSLEIAYGFRTVRLNLYNQDISYVPWSVSGTSARVFLMITYNGATALRFRSISRLSNGQVIINSQNTTLGGPLATGNTVPLNIMGGGTYSFSPMITPMYYLAVYGGRVLSDAEMDRIYADRYQNIEPGYVFPYAAIATGSPEVQAAITQTEQGESQAAQLQVLAQIAVTQAEQNENNLVSLRIAAQASVTQAEQGESVSALARISLSVSISQSEQNETTQISGSIGSGANLSIAQAEQSEVVAVSAQVRVSGAVAWSEGAEAVSLIGQVRLAGALGWIEQSDLHALQMSVIAGDGGEIDAFAVPRSRIVVFEGGRRIVAFEGSARVVTFEGAKRMVEFE